MIPDFPLPCMCSGQPYRYCRSVNVYRYLFIVNVFRRFRRKTHRRIPPPTKPSSSPVPVPHHHRNRRWKNTVSVRRIRHQQDSKERTAAVFSGLHHGSQENTNIADHGRKKSSGNVVVFIKKKKNKFKKN